MLTKNLDIKESESDESLTFGCWFSPRCVGGGEGVGVNEARLAQKRRGGNGIPATFCGMSSPTYSYLNTHQEKKKLSSQQPTNQP